MRLPSPLKCDARDANLERWPEARQASKPQAGARLLPVLVVLAAALLMGPPSAPADAKSLPPHSLQLNHRNSNHNHNHHRLHPHQEPSDESLSCGQRFPATVDGRSQQQQQQQQQQQMQRLRSRQTSAADQRGNASAAPHESLLYIVGGDEVEADQFWPWSVAIYELDPLNGRRNFICSGSLISARFVLTAAHCIHQSRFDLLTPDDIYLKLASIRLDDPEAPFYEVAEVFIHPEYQVERKANDIALLRLAAHQALPEQARPICLPPHVANRIDFTDQLVTIIGWGRTSALDGDEPRRLIHQETEPGNGQPLVQPPSVPGGPNLPSWNDVTTTNELLIQAEVRIMNTDQCNKNYSRLDISWLNIDEHFLCASDPQGKKDACQGDSGGPLMWNNQQAADLLQQQSQLHSAIGGGAEAGAPADEATIEKWYQLGLVSFGHGCANSQYPGVYTRITYYMPWISKIMQD